MDPEEAETTSSPELFLRIKLMDDLRGEETTRETGELAKEQHLGEQVEEEQVVVVVVLGRKVGAVGERFIEREEERFIFLIPLSLQELLN